MRLRRLCFAIFAFRLFLSEPIRIFSFACLIQTFDQLLCKWVEAQPAYCFIVASRLVLNSLSGFHSGNLSPLATS